MDSFPQVTRRHFMIGTLLAGSLYALGSSQEDSPHTPTIKIASRLPMNEQLADYRYGIQKSLFSLEWLNEYYQNGLIECQKYAIDCEITSVTHALSLLGINLQNNRPYSVDNIIQYLPRNIDPRIGVHPDIENTLIIGNNKNRLHGLPPEPYGIMPGPIQIVLNQNILNGTEQKAFILGTKLQPTIDEYWNFIHGSVGKFNSPVVWWHNTCDEDPTNFNGLRVSRGEHAALIIGAGEESIKYLDPLTMQIYYEIGKQNIFKRGHDVGNGLLAILPDNKLTL